MKKLLILHIVAFMPLEIAKQLLSNFYPNVNPKNGVTYKKKLVSKN